MKIAIWGYHPQSTSGLGKVTFLLQNTLQKLKHKVTVIAYQSQNFGQQNDVICVNRTNISDVSQFVINENYDLLISIGDLWNFEPIFNIVSKKPIKWIAYVGSEGESYPCIARISKEKSIDISQITEMISAVWAYDRRALDIFRKQFKLDGYVLPHSVDIETIKNANPVPLKQIFGIENKKKLLIFVGDNIRRKGIDLILKTIKKSSNFVAYLHTPIYREEIGIDLIEAREALDLKDKLLLFSDLSKILQTQVFPNEFVYGLYKSADVYFHPHRAEGFGLTVLEALVAGIPTLASDCGGPKSFLPKECSIPIEYQTYEQFGGVGYIVNQPQDINDEHLMLAINNHIHFDANRYSCDTFCRRIKELLEKHYTEKLWMKL